MLINGGSSGKGQITVQNSGSILGGTGSAAAAVSIVNSGTLNAGNNVGVGGASSTVGTLSVGALTLDSKGLAVFNLNSGNIHDRLLADGAISLGGSTLTLNVNSSTTAYTVGQTLVLFRAGSDGLSGTFNDFTNNGLYSYGADTFRANYTALQFILPVTSVTPVPEPATWLGGLWLLALCGYRRCRRRVRVA